MHCGCCVKNKKYLHRTLQIFPQASRFGKAFYFCSMFGHIVGCSSPFQFSGQEELLTRENLASHPSFIKWQLGVHCLCWPDHNFLLLFRSTTSQISRIAKWRLKCKHQAIFQTIIWKGEVLHNTQVPTFSTALNTLRKLRPASFFSSSTAQSPESSRATKSSG